VIHLYAFALGLRGLPDITGLEDAPLASQCFGGVTGVVSASAGGADASVDAARHGLVVEALVDRARAVLPVRFGQRFSSSEELAALVGTRSSSLLQRLEQLVDCVEIGVRARGPEEHPPAADATGVDYMRRLAARRGVVEELHRALRARALEARASADSVSYLVRRGDVSDFAKEVKRHIVRHPELTIVCTGPWAPYSFAEAE